MPSLRSTFTHKIGLFALIEVALITGCAPGSDGTAVPGDASTGTGGTGAAADGGGRDSGADLPGSGGNSGSGGAASGSGGTTASGGTAGLSGSGGSGGSGGGSPAATGGRPGSGGAAGGGAASGGSTATGGAASGGRGGAGTGGGVATGGAGGTATGGAAGAGTADITVWLAGDSTMANGSSPCPIGWGAKFQSHFNSHVKVTNKAIGGRSVQTWLYDVSSTLGSDGECVLNSKTYLAAWTEMLNGMKAGDYLLIQFGINDTDSACPKHVGTELFKTYFGTMAQAAKDRGANPIFLTPVSSISCSGSTATATRGRFATATKEAGTKYNIPVIDLEQLSVKLYTSLGFCPLPGPDSAATFQSGEIGKFFCEDHTHFETDGAAQIATVVAKAVKDQAFGLASYLNP